MKKRTKPAVRYGTYDNICVYQAYGQDLIRKASSLVGNGDRVKTEAVFQNTMKSAGRLATGSKLASMVYALLPLSRKSDKLRRKLVGQAVRLLKAGDTATAVVVELMITIRLPKRNRKKKAIVRTLPATSFRLYSDRDITPPCHTAPTCRPVFSQRHGPGFNMVVS